MPGAFGQPFNLILVCRPESHTTLYEHIEGIELRRFTTKRWTGRVEETDTYRYLNDLPTRKNFFDDLRTLTRYLSFENWDNLLTFMPDGLVLALPPNIS